MLKGFSIQPQAEVSDFSIEILKVSESKIVDLIFFFLSNFYFYLYFI